jgi:aspartyl-tRNA(Asn)/glutamyl-tRNA(Gln) amidotransferase subunit B
MRARLPELPDAKRDRFISELGLTRYDASVLVADQAIAAYFEDVLAAGANAKTAANWILGNLFSLVNRDNAERESVIERVPARYLASLVTLIDDGAINKNTGVVVLTDMWETGGDPAQIVADKGLAQVSDTGAIDAAIDKVLGENDKLVGEYMGGKDKVFGPLLGKVMAATGGKANPQVARERLQAALYAKKA